MQTAVQPRLSLAAGISHPISRGFLVAVAASAFVALCAHISIPLPFTPVPLTMQTFAVILLGTLMGPVAGFAAMVLYLAEGLAGMPVFSPHGAGGAAQLFGPTGGYLLSYPLAAAASGGIVRLLRQSLPSYVSTVAGGLLASALILTLGAAWVSTSLHLSLPVAWHLAILPFLPGEALKVAAVAGFASLTHRAGQR